MRPKGAYFWLSTKTIKKVSFLTGEKCEHRLTKVTLFKEEKTNENEELNPTFHSRASFKLGTIVNEALIPEVIFDKSKGFIYAHSLEEESKDEIIARFQDFLFAENEEIQEKWDLEYNFEKRVPNSCIIPKK